MPVTAICTNAQCARETVYPDDYLYCMVECSHCKKKFRLYPLSAPVSRGKKESPAAPSAAPRGRRPGRAFPLLPRFLRDLRADWRRAFQRLPAQQRVRRNGHSRRDAGSTPPSECGESDDALQVPREPGLPRRIGRFLVRARLGQGGFGTVYRAHDPQLERDVALKVPRPGTLDHPQRVQRFLGDAKAAARLRHPHIVPVFDAGQDGADYYIASAYVEGRTLKDAIDEGTLTLGDSVRIVRALAEALAYAHSLGIVHRDVKPANVMLDCKGQPHLIDFGLAHRQHLIEEEWTDPLDPDWPHGPDRGEERTRDGAVFGTPAYMAPEQARGRHGDPLPASDQYSLGVLLYELLCGQTPFDGPTPVLLFNHVHTPPPPPSTVNRQVPPDLEAVCLKALAKRPEQRYAGCQEMADDLRRCLEGEPIRIRRPGPIERLVRWCRREPKLAGAVGAAAAALVVVLVLAVGFGIQQARLAWEQLEHVRELRTANEQTENARQEAEQRLASSLVDRGQNLGEQGEVALAMLWMAKGLEIATEAHGGEDLDQTIRMNLASWSHLLHPLRQCLVPEHPDKVWAVAVSPDGKTILTGSGNETEEKGRVRLWDTATGKVWESPPQGGPVRAVAFSRDGRRFLTGSRGEALLWDAARLQVVSRLAHTQLSVTAAAFSPDGSTVLTGCSSLDRDENGDVRLWDVASGKELWHFTRPLKSVWSVAYSPDGRTLAAGSGDRLQGEARLWDAANRDQSRVLGQHRHAVHAVAFSPDGKSLLTSSGGLFEGEARVWDIATDQPLVEPLAHQAEVYAVAYSPDGRMLLTGGQDRAVRLWDLAGKPMGPILWHPKDVRAAAFSPDGRRIVTGSEDGTVRVWQVTTGTPGRIDRNPWALLIATAWSRDGRTVLTGTTRLSIDLRDLNKLSKSEARLYDAATGQPRGRALPHDSPVTAVALSPDSQVVATGCFDGTIWLWDAAAGKCLGRCQDHANVVSSIAFSPDGQTLATGSWDHTARLYAVATGKPISPAMWHRDKVYAVAFSPTGKIVATGSRDETAQLWHAATGQPAGEPLPHPDAVLSVAFSPGPADDTLLTGYAGGARLWDTEKRKVYGPTFPHQAGVFGVAFSPDGKTVLTGGTDRTARLWNRATGKPLGPPLRHDGAVMAVAFAPDGRTVLTGSLDGTTRLWRIGAPLEGDLERVRLWTEVQTGIELIEGVPHVLSGAEWNNRRKRLDELPAAPELEQAFQAPGRVLPIEPPLPPPVVPLAPQPPAPMPVVPPPSPPPAADVSAPPKPSPKPATVPATPPIPAVEAEPGPLERYLPDDTEMVLRVNVRQVLNSALAKDTGLEARLKEWLRDVLPAPAEAQQVLDDLGLDLFKHIDSLTIATPKALDRPLILLRGQFDVDKFQAKAEEMVASDRLKVHALRDGQGKLYETNLPTLPAAFYVKLVNKSTLVLSPWEDYLQEAYDKEAGRKKTHLTKELVGLLAKADTKQALWMAALPPDDLKKMLAREDNTREFADKIDGFTGAVGIDKDVQAAFHIFTADAKAADGIAELLDNLKGLAKVYVQNNAKMGELLGDVIDSIKIATDKAQVDLTLKVDKETITKLLKR